MAGEVARGREKRLEEVINQDLVVVAEITFWQPNGGRSRGELPLKTTMTHDTRLIITHTRY
jgi:hypothetical protein